ncbi:MAG: transcription-repair coupling factor [Bryobacteraceae bacterium]|nr:transcription-repair coupling factor [Bryobacteraceae bacterium]
MTHPSVRELFESFGRHPAFLDLLGKLSRADATPQRYSLSGLTLTAKALYLVLLQQVSSRPLLVLVDGNKQAEALIELVRTFFDLLIEDTRVGRPQLFPALDVIPSQNLSPHSELAEERAVALWRLSSQPVPITIAPVASALLRLENRDFYRQLALTLKTGDEVSLEDVVTHLRSIGYEQRDPVELVGEFSVRGGILDVFPPETEQPVRVEFFGDSIESMRRFDSETQRSTLNTKEAVVLPLLEYPKSRALFRELAQFAVDRVSMAGEEFPGWEFWVPIARPRTSSVFRMLRDAVVIIDEPEAVGGAVDRFWKRLKETEKSADFAFEKIYLSSEELLEETRRFQTVALRELDVVVAGAAESAAIPTRPSIAFHGNMQLAVAEGRSVVERGGRVVYFAPASGELERIADILQEYRVPFQLGIDTAEATAPYLAERMYLAGAYANTFLVRGRVPRGTFFADPNVALFGFEDLFDVSDIAGPAGKTRRAAAAFQADIADLKPGDFVVHTQHGVGKFLGVRSINQGEQAGDFMLVEYANEAKLYVPLTRLDLIQKFRGAGEGAAPPLDRMGGATWQKTKSRVKAKMRDMADELLKLYASRKMAEGFAFSPDSNWQREFEDAFEYTATKDQVHAVRQIKKDMESDTPMDRLLVGDVGFGKTEVAMRAAFKALGDGKQVAVLAPTTVLVLQHFESFRRRFQSFPVRIEMLSRFRNAKEIKETLEQVEAGKVDLVIGTHRLLSKDVVFHDLGLLVVDEEQRFGVRHKERLKEIRKNVDVLTMSATPIPRTLHMSLLGLRDMSTIETPPKDRLAIHTVVAHFEKDLIRTAIEQELSRGGQVYFVHNRVDSIFMRAAMIQEMLPQIRVGVGHGQMAEAELERVLLGFMKHEYDVFVCTTIVENGIDIPRANTIIIENAERHGLSELYQLRGRVGRSNKRAYAYLLVPADTELSEVARKRLAALKEFSDLGAGFKIAALDLELRGAGNILGGEQHGHIGSVGFDTYLRLLEETVHELKGEEVEPEIHASLNLGLDIRISAEYIADEQQRMRAYKRISEAATQEDAVKIREELEDRYGAPPEGALNLLQFSVLKTVVEKAGVEAIDRRSGMLNVKFHQAARVDPARLMEIVKNTPGAQFTPAGVLRLPLTGLDSPAQILGYLTRLFTIDETSAMPVM